MTRSSHTDINATALRQLDRILTSAPKRYSTVNITIEHSEDIIEVSRDVADSLRILLINAVAGKTVSIIPTSAELTTQQAATLLNVSRPHVVKLIEQGILPGHRVGSHRRLYATDVQKYKDERDDVSRTAMNELIELSEELGLYE